MGFPCITSRLWRGGSFAAAPAAPATAEVKVTRQDNLIGWWKFDETSGSTAADSSDTGNDATLTQSGSSDAGFDSSGKNGYCVILDGTDDEVTIPAESAYGVAPFSITAWIEADSHVLYAPIIQADLYTAAGTINVAFRSSTTVDVVKFKQTSSYTIDTHTIGDYTGAWHHFAMTVAAVGDGTYATKVYWDADQKSATRSTGGGSAGIWSDAMDTNVAWQVGRDRVNFDLDGRIDDLRIYDIALTAGNVEDIYNSGDGDWP